MPTAIHTVIPVFVRRMPGFLKLLSVCVCVSAPRLLITAHVK